MPPLPKGGTSIGTCMNPTCTSADQEGLHFWDAESLSSKHISRWKYLEATSACQPHRVAYSSYGGIPDKTPPTFLLLTETTPVAGYGVEHSAHVGMNKLCRAG